MAKKIRRTVSPFVGPNAKHPMNVVAEGDELLKSASRLLEIAPWDVFYPDEYVVVKFDDLELTFNTFAMLGSEDLQGVVAYRSIEDARLARTADTERPPIDQIGLIFYRRADVERERVKAFTELGYPTELPLPIATFMARDSKTPGPVSVADDARSLSACCGALVAFLLEHLDHMDPEEDVITAVVDLPEYGRAKVTFHATQEPTGEDPFEALEEGMELIADENEVELEELNKTEMQALIAHFELKAEASKENQILVVRSSADALQDARTRLEGATELHMVLAADVDEMMVVVRSPSGLAGVLGPYPAELHELIFEKCTTPHIFLAITHDSGELTAPEDLTSLKKLDLIDSDLDELKTLLAQTP